MSLLMTWIKHSLRLFLYSIWLLYSNDLKSLLILDFMLQKSRDSIHCSHSRNPGSRPSTRTFWRVNGFPVSPGQKLYKQPFEAPSSRSCPILSDFIFNFSPPCRLHSSRISLRAVPEPARRAPASGPLYLLFSSPGKACTSLSHFHPSFTNSKSFLNSHLLGEVFLVCSI